MFSVAKFFAGTSWRVDFLCRIRHGDTAKVFDRLPRLEFDEATKTI